MSEDVYGYAAMPPFGIRHDAATNLKDMDKALRAEILSNARKQYEAAARKLRLRAQAEVQAQQAQILRRQGHARLPLYERPGTSQERVLERSSARTYPGPHIRTAGGQPSNSSRYSAPPLPSRPSSNLPSPSTNTPTAMLYHFRQLPEKINNAISKDKGGTKEENNLALEELKRRYYAQVADQEGASYSRATYNRNKQGPHHNIDGSRGHTVVIGRPDSRYGSYRHANPTGHARTMADEYLDYYMPARRGPHSVPSHQRHGETSYRQVRREASEQIHRRGGPERICRQEMERRTGTYEPEPRPSHREEETSPRSSHSAGNEQMSKPPPVRQHPAAEPQLSKGKLAFVLNPSEPGNSRSMHQPNQDESSDGKGHSGIHPSSSGSYSPGLGMQSGVSSKRMQEDALYAHHSGRTKRKAPLSPDSPNVSDAGSEDETPRPKRRAFGRLPTEVDNQSELGPEEEETDAAYVAEMSWSSKALELEWIRNAVEHPVTDRTEGLKPSSNPRNPPENPETDRHTRGFSKRLEVTRKPENRGRKIDVDDEDNSDGVAAPDIEVSIGRVSRASPAENKKYHFRSRTRPPHSR